MKQLPTGRGLLKCIFLGAITFGIYNLVVFTRISKEINIVAANDGKKTMNFCLLLFIFSWLPLGIGPIVWIHRISGRMGNQLKVRNVDYGFGAKTFWLWGVLGSMLFGIGPLIFLYKFLKTSNLLNAAYNKELEDKSAATQAAAATTTAAAE